MLVTLLGMVMDVRLLQPRYLQFALYQRYCMLNGRKVVMKILWIEKRMKI